LSIVASPRILDPGGKSVGPARALVGQLLEFKRWIIATTTVPYGEDSDFVIKRNVVDVISAGW
jgi:hypothetical protein